MNPYNKSFKCPLNKEDHVCPKCDIKTTCKERKKKHIFNACGCGGRFDCICGYEETFCIYIGIDEKTCPFCGRLINAVHNGLMIAKWESVPINNYVNEIVYICKNCGDNIESHKNMKYVDYQLCKLCQQEIKIYEEINSN